MSTDRDQILIQGRPDTLVVDLIAEIRTRTGCNEIELAYDAADRTLADDEEPGPHDDVAWTATAFYKRRGKIPARQITGTHTQTAGHVDTRGPALALVNLVERMGINVVLIDRSDGSDPRD